MEHKNILRHCRRPFDPRDVEAMNEKIISNFNDKVGERDIVYFLGDFAWTKNPQRLWYFANKLNGLWTFVMGNHDYGMNLRPFFEELVVFQKVGTLKISELEKLKIQCRHIVDLKTIRWQKEKLILCHYPLASWDASHHGSWHLHGHVHSKLQKNNGKKMDIGVDANSFWPVSFDEVKRYMDKQLSPEEQLDYHASLV